MEQLDDLTSGRLQGEIMSRIRVAIRGRSHWLIWLRHVSVSTSTLVFSLGRLPLDCGRSQYMYKYIYWLILHLIQHVASQF